MHDLLVSTTIDLVPNWTGGLAEGDGEVIDSQDINFRVRLNDPDLATHAIGANLEDLAGKPNTPATGSAGEASILRSLTIDGRFKARELTLQSVPLGQNTIGFFVGKTSPSKTRTSVPLFMTALQLST